MSLSARLEAVAALCPAAPVVVDVGADHGRLAAAVGAIAVERMPHRRGPARARWVVCDGLRAFRAVDVALVAGMGARRIASILAGPCQVRRAAVVQAPDDPGWLRTWAAAHGWRIDAELLTLERDRYYETVRLVPGVETADTDALWVGPRLVTGDHPLREQWLERHIDHIQGVLAAIGSAAPARSAELERRLRRLESWRR
jgi:tRNA A22 N-methylase